MGGGPSKNDHLQCENESLRTQNVQKTAENAVLGKKNEILMATLGTFAVLFPFMFRHGYVLGQFKQTRQLNEHLLSGKLRAAHLPQNLPKGTPPQFGAKPPTSK